MAIQRFATWTVTALLAAATVGCGSKKHKDDSQAPEAQQPEAQGPQEETYDQELGNEYSQLPASVVIAADADENGNPVAGTEEMRAAAGDASAGAIDDADQAESAYEAGSLVVTASSTDELDQDTSSQSWTDYKGNNDYNQYQPKVHSKKQRGYQYNYGKVRNHKKARRVYYVYHRPACTPRYCQTDGGQNPGQYPGQQNPGQQYPDQGYPNIDQSLRTALQQYGVYDVKDTEFYAGSLAKFELGGRLFYDTLLSANGDMACASCHIQKLGTTSLYSLGATGEVMSGRKRGNLTRADLLARNAPALYNVGHKSLGTMFWDSRISASSSEPSGFFSPLGEQLPQGLESALAVQALFPLITGAEMGCGIVGMKTFASQAVAPMWSEILTRVLARTDYQQMFAAAYPEASGQYGIEHLANAIASFESKQWRAINSPFDRYVRGDERALTQTQKIGATYFYGKAKCATCHSGPLQTDHGRHAIAMPQFGPGAGDGPNGYEDLGFGRISGNPSDNYKFKTPSLRNVSVSGPWGHNGAYRSLRTFVEHYRNPRATHDMWRPDMAVLPAGFHLDRDLMGAWGDQQARERVKAASEVDQVPMTDAEVEAMMQFLLSLTDPSVAQNQSTHVVNGR